MRKIIAPFIILLVSLQSNAQIGIGINPPDPSAILHVQDTARGLLIPRMTEAQRIAIVNPAQGLLVYQTNNSEGVWNFINGQWRNLSASNNGGKHTLYLSDGITNAQALAKIATDVGPNTQEIRIVRCTNLTSVDLSMISNLTEIYISGNTVLQSVNLGNLQSVDGGIWIDQCPALTGLPITQLHSIGLSVNGSYGIRLTNTAIPALNLPLVTSVNGTILVANNPSLTTINFPQLIEHLPNVSASPFLSIHDNGSLSSVLFPSLTKAQDVNVYSNNNIATANFSALTTVNNGIIVSNAGFMTSLLFPVLTKAVSLQILSNGMLNAVTVPMLDSLPGELSIQSNTLLTSVSFPILKSALLLTISNNAALASLSVPILSRLTSTSTSLQNTISACPSLTTIFFPALVTNNNLLITFNAGLTSISLPSLTTTGNIQMSGNANLTSISFDALTTISGVNIQFNSNKLPSSQVNYLLHKFVSISPALNGTDIFLFQTPPAPPTGQGIIDRDALAGSNYVQTD